MAKTKALTKKEQESALAVTALMDQYDNDGYEEADADSYAIPFLRILQPTSPQLMEDADGYINGAKAGMFFNSVNNKVYGKSIEVINIHYKRDFIEWKPNREGFVQSHGSDPSILKRIAEITDKNEQILDNGNLIQDFRNHFVLLPNDIEDGPMIFSLASTGIRHSKKWMSLMRMLKNPATGKTGNPLFMGVWKLTTVLNESDDGKWYMIGTKTSSRYEFIRMITADEFELVKETRDLVLSDRAHIDYESQADKQDDDIPF